MFSVNAMKWNALKFCKADRDMKKNIPVQLTYVNIGLSWKIYACIWILIACASQYVAAVDDFDLSSLTTSQGFTMTSGGYSVSGAGDINGDGVGDMIVGSPWTDSNNGMAYVVFGKKNTLTSSVSLPSFPTGPSTGFRIIPYGSGDKLGWSVSKAGDINKDGVDDVIIGAKFADPSSRTNAGITYVIYGRAVSLGVNEFQDIYLPNAAMSPMVGFRILGAANNDESGTSVSAAGDVNGDGIDDVIVGAPEADPPGPGTGSNAGIAYVVYGKITAIGDIDLSNIATGSDLGFRILGADIGDRLGYSVSGAGDVNNDGVSDVIVGAPYADPPGVDFNSNEGVSYVIFGRKVTSPANRFNDVILLTAALPAATGFRMIGATYGDLSGCAVSRAGDVNGDGVGDVIVGAMSGNSGSGITFVIFGRNIPGGASTFTDTELITIATGSPNGFRIYGADTSDSSGAAVSAAGDVNGDGIDDILIGAKGAAPNGVKINAGIAYVIYGRRSVGGATVFSDMGLSNIASGSLSGFRILGAATNDAAGFTVSGAGDINGDGGRDIMVGTPAGSSYVICGVPPNPTSQPSSQPSRQPSRQPSGQPTRQPSRQPSSQPSRQPSNQPSGQPTVQPSVQPSRQPSSTPTKQPFSQPSGQPSCQPSGQPSRQPSNQPTSQPSKQPSTQPTQQPSVQPLASPTTQPSCQPSGQPSRQPSSQPTWQPSGQPSVRPSRQPSANPSVQPSAQPTGQPSVQPSLQPQSLPSAQPSRQPSPQPSRQPSSQPSRQPSNMPSSQPSSQPSAQPTVQPSSWPSYQPTNQPSAQPSSQPSFVPSAQASMEPTTQPSIAPSAQPSSNPSAQPSSLPTVQPSVSPSSHPSVFPSSQPSNQPAAVPTVQPSAQPTSQPSVQPTSFPTSQPSGEPANQPSSLPSTQPSGFPSGQPSSHPSITPSAQPSVQPSTLPSSQPTSQPTGIPTVYPTARLDQGMWLTLIDSLQAEQNVAVINSDIWTCGSKNKSTACAILDAQMGTILVDYAFVWNHIVGVFQADDASRVMLSGSSTSQTGPVSSDLANCEISQASLTCSVKSFYDTNATAVTYVPLLYKVLLIGVQNPYASASVIDVRSGAVQSYLYSSKLLQLFTLSQTVSPPNFIGSFVAGAAVSTTGFNFIIAGMVRADSGTMTALYLSPVSGTILNSAQLVNAMALEYEHPDSFIAGGLQLSDGIGMHAYLLRVNALIGALKYCVRYRASTVGTRRVLSTSLTDSSTVRGMVLVDSVIYLVSDLLINSSTSASVLKVDAATGLILQQAHVFSSNASLSCTDITASTRGSFLYLACQIERDNAAVENVVISTDSALTFAKVPQGFMVTYNIVFTSEMVPFKKTSLPVSMRVAQSYVVDSELFTEDRSPTLRPSAAPIQWPSSRPSTAPSGQPSSRPTSAPSVSPQPSSQPSTSGPTITYRPTVKPTQRPSTRPIRVPTRPPSPKPSIRPTARPSRKPSPRPSALPTKRPSTAPSRVPTGRPSRSPTVQPSQIISVAPSSISTTVNAEGVEEESQGKKSDIALVIGGSIVGGLLALWCGKWFIKSAKKAWEHLERKKALREMLMTSRILIDPVQQRIVNETVRQRCEEVSTTGHLPHSTSSARTLTYPAAPPQVRGAERPVGAYASGRPLAPPTEVVADASVIQSELGSDCPGKISARTVLSALPGEPLAAETPSALNGVPEITGNNINNTGDAQRHLISTLVNNNSDGDISISECSDSSDATSSSSERVDSTDGSMYSFPSSLSD